MYILTEQKLKELEERELAGAKIPRHSRESLKIKSILSRIFKMSIEEIEECLDYKKNTPIAKEVRFRGAMFSLFDHQNTLDSYLEKWDFKIE